MLTEDFTKLPLGAMVSQARPIVRCPICRRRGALDIRQRRCVHVEGSEIESAGMLVEPIDSCAVVSASASEAALGRSIG
ncbi:MAG TPA: hypothetical protein VMH79_05295 [Thermoanaerobaculia bacterium]|nr:hypothetical protein [Thermoanaerobaculia bacterium]